MESVCLDTNIVIWGIKKEANDEDFDNIEKAEYLIETLSQEKSRIIIPSVVIGEIAARTPRAKLMTILYVLQSRFLVVPYDTRVALKFGELFKMKNQLRKDEGEVTRKKFKADLQIIATAVVHGASCIYSHDDDVIKFGKDVIEVRHLPPLPPRQMEMYDDSID